MYTKRRTSFPEVHSTPTTKNLEQDKRYKL